MAPERQRVLLAPSQEWQLTVGSKEFWNRRPDSDSQPVTTATFMATATSTNTNIIITTITTFTLLEQAIQDVGKLFSRELICPSEGSRFV